MKLLVFHPFAGSPVRQEYWEDVRQHLQGDIALVVPSVWRGDYGQAVTAQRSPYFKGQVIESPVILRGNIPLHVNVGRLSRIIRRQAPDMIYVYHEPYGVSTFQVFCANRRSVDAPIGFYSSQNIRKTYPTPFRQMERYVFRCADYAVSVSRNVANVLTAKGYRGPIVQSPFYVDTEKFHPGSEFRRAHEGEHPLRVGFVGRLVPEKGVHVLLEAIADLPRDRVSLDIVGSGPADEHLRRHAAQLGLADAVRWRGFMNGDRLAQFYRELDVLAVPSLTTRRWKEQFGRVVLEAGASGAAVVSSDSGELPYVVAQTGAGWVVPEGDPGALRSRLRTLATNRESRHQTTSRAVSIIRQQFDRKVVAQRFARSLQEVL